MPANAKPDIAPLLSRPEKAAILFWLLFLTGCTVIPQREFTDYQHAFSQVQKAGEQVIIDYAVAQKEEAVFKQLKTEPGVRYSSFNSRQLTLSQVPIEDVAIRLQAFEVVGSYNRVLANLIAERPANAEAETHTLLKTLMRFSVSALRSAAAKLSPTAAALSAILGEVKKGLERRRIVKTMENISPLISSGLIANMKKDTELFYNVRYGLNNRDYGKLRVSIGRHIKEFVRLGSMASSKDVQPMVKALNLRLAQIAKSSTGHGFKPIEFKAGTGSNPVLLSQLNVLKMQILMLLDDAERLDLKLEAYREMLTAYVRMLSQLDLHLKILQQAAIDRDYEKLNIEEEFNIALTQMRQAHAYYLSIP